MGYTNINNTDTYTFTEKKGVNLTHIDTNNTYIDTNVDKYQKSKEVELIAGKLVGLLDNPGSYQFYCLIGWRLPENKIWKNYESAIATKNGDPRKIFTWLCKRDLANV